MMIWAFILPVCTNSGPIPAKTKRIKTILLSALPPLGDDEEDGDHYIDEW